jgi:hypothetical protein
MILSQDQSACFHTHIDTNQSFFDVFGVTETANYVDFMTINLDEHISQRFQVLAPLEKMKERSRRW